MCYCPSSTLVSLWCQKNRKWQQKQVQTRWKREHLKVSSIAHHSYCLSFQRASFTPSGHSLGDWITLPVSFKPFISISDPNLCVKLIQIWQGGPSPFPPCLPFSARWLLNLRQTPPQTRKLPAPVRQRHKRKSSPLGCVMRWLFFT